MQIIVFKTLKSGKNLYLYLYRPSPIYTNTSQASICPESDTRRPQNIFIKSNYRIKRSDFRVKVECDFLQRIGEQIFVLEVRGTGEGLIL